MLFLNWYPGVDEPFRSSSLKMTICSKRNTLRSLLRDRTPESCSVTKNVSCCSNFPWAVNFPCAKKHKQSSKHWHIQYLFITWYFKKVKVILFLWFSSTAPQTNCLHFLETDLVVQWWKNKKGNCNFLSSHSDCFSHIVSLFLDILNYKLVIASIQLPILAFFSQNWEFIFHNSFFVARVKLKT